MKNLFLSIVCFLFFLKASAQNQKVIIAYYSGNHEQFKNYPIEKLTHIIYSFLRLSGNRLSINPENNDDLHLKTLVDLKQKYPQLKVSVAFGGWAGCETCSDVFSSEKNRVAFAKSVRKILELYNLDGIDLDWEYPAIQGEIGHGFKPEDKQDTNRQYLDPREGKSYETGLKGEFFNKQLNASLSVFQTQQNNNRRYIQHTAQRWN